MPMALFQNPTTMQITSRQKPQYTLVMKLWKMRLPEDDRIDMRQQVEHLSDYNRYIVTIGSKSAVVTAWWRKSGKTNFGALI